MNDDNQRTESMIDEVLQSYPQVALPPGLVNRIMLQVEAQPRPQPERFQLQFLDIALALCFGGMITLLLVVIFATLGIVNLNWLPANVLSSFSFITLSASARFWFILGIVLFAEVGLGAAVCLQLWQDRPYAAT